MCTHDARPEIVWITGAQGFLGRYMLEAFQRSTSIWNVIPLSRPMLDLTDLLAVKRRFKAESPSLIVHCAALADSGECEVDPNRSRTVNVDVTQHLAQLAGDRRFIFMSTDLVFDGRQGNYTERDDPNPLHVYGRHKFEAERIVLQNPRHTVVRTSLNAGYSRAGDRSFNERMVSAWRAGRPLTLFRDEYRNPIAAPLTARTLLHIAEQRLTGLFHVAGREKLSRLDLGYLCRDQHQTNGAQIIEGSLANFQGPPRAADTTLNCTKIQAELPFSLLGLQEWLDIHTDRPF